MTIIVNYNLPRFTNITNSWKNSLAGLWGRLFSVLVLIKRYDGMKIGVLSSILHYVNTSIITLCVGFHCSKDLLLHCGF